MQNTAQKLPWQAFQEHARIVGRQGDVFLAAASTGLVPAVPAVSCLVKPEIGDLALLSIGEGENAFILGILERPGRTKKVLSFESDLDIECPSGRIVINAREGVDLATSQDLRLASARLLVHSGLAEAHIEQATFWGRLWQSNVTAVKIVSETLDMLVDRLWTRARRSYRFVKGLDQVRSGQLNVQAEESLLLRGRYAQMTAEEDVRLDGRQIHLG